VTSEEESTGPEATQPCAKGGGACARVPLASLVASAGVLAAVLISLIVFGRAGVGRAGGAVEAPTFLGAGAPFRDWRYIVIHHSATEGGSAAAIERFHVLVRGWPRIGYHFVIGNGSGCGDGELQVTDTWRNQLEGIHTGRRLYNAEGIAVCLVGDFELAPPSPAQMRTLTALCRALLRRFDIPVENVLRHGDIANTKCPGKYFPRDFPARALEAKPREK